MSLQKPWQNTQNTEHPENTVPKARRVLGEAQMPTASVGQKITQKSDKRLFWNQLHAGKVKGLPNLAQDTNSHTNFLAFLRFHVA